MGYVGYIKSKEKAAKKSVQRKRKSDQPGADRDDRRSVPAVNGQDVTKSVHQKNLLNQRWVSIN